MARKFVSSTPENKSYIPLVIIIFLLLFFVYYLWNRVSSIENTLAVASHERRLPVRDVRFDVGRCNGSTNGDTLSNPYVPPVKCDAGRFMTTSSSNEIPINIPTQQFNSNYTQIGIITKQFVQNNEILPLMGRRTLTSRDKWQYYTISGGGAGGNLQAKLPVKVKGRNCSGEYGCDEIANGDEVFVEGYQENFRATIYENGLFSYIP